MLRPDDSDLEEVEDALVDGDVAYQRGTAQAALRNANFRKVYFGTFASNVGTWMQNVILGAYALKLTGSPAFVGLIFFAQLGPLLFLSTTGGLLADTVDRRRLLVSAQLAQMLLSFGLAAIVLTDEPSRVALV
ncbi:MAG TPA: MFS transporter, partial [Acidimicrobiia bacterium]|nr:MFS transporter [Acidimicrobiia bacterium]